MKRATSILLLVISIGLTGCGEWDDEYDFRNYLRDEHPYSVINKIDLHGMWSYEVNDTIKGEIWVYTSNRSESSVKSHCVTCEKENS